MDTVKEIESIQDLLQVLHEDNQDYQGDIWYRGHHESNWQLTPAYYRLDNPPSESTLLKKFKQSAAMLIDTSPKEAFDWLFLMQHYGVPTRLLDWTESPLIALYFAVEAAQTEAEETDSALWSLRPSELNRHANIHNAAEDFYIPSFDDDELQTYSVASLAGNPRIQLHPVATIATRNNARIQAQLGVFTIHHLERAPIEAIGDGAHARKYLIPSRAKPAIRNQLHLLGFTKFQLFPELPSIGDLIREQL